MAGRCAAPLSGLSWGEKPNPISIPGPWPCGQRTARGFSFGSREVESRESKVNKTVLSTSEKKGRLSLALWAGRFPYCRLDTGSTKLEIRPSPAGRGCPATAFLPAGAGRVRGQFHGEERSDGRWCVAEPMRSPTAPCPLLYEGGEFSCAVATRRLMRFAL